MFRGPQILTQFAGTGSCSAGDRQVSERLREGGWAWKIRKDKHGERRRNRMKQVEKAKKCKDYTVTVQSLYWNDLGKTLGSAWLQRWREDRGLLSRFACPQHWTLTSASAPFPFIGEFPEDVSFNILQLCMNWFSGMPTLWQRGITWYMPRGRTNLGRRAHSTSKAQQTQVTLLTLTPLVFPCFSTYVSEFATVHDWIPANCCWWSTMVNHGQPGSLQVCVLEQMSVQSSGEQPQKGRQICFAKSFHAIPCWALDCLICS